MEAASDTITSYMLVTIYYFSVLENMGLYMQKVPATDTTVHIVNLTDIWVEDVRMHIR